MSLSSSSSSSYFVEEAAGISGAELLQDAQCLDSALCFTAGRRLEGRLRGVLSMVKALMGRPMSLDRLCGVVAAFPDVFELRYDPDDAQEGLASLDASIDPFDNAPFRHRIDRIQYFLALHFNKKLSGKSATAKDRRLKNYKGMVKNLGKALWIAKAAIPPLPFSMEAQEPQPTQAAFPMPAQSLPVTNGPNQLAALYKKNKGNALDFGGIIQFLKDCPFYESQLIHQTLYEKRDLVTEKLQLPLHPALERVLKENLKITSLFKHQARAIDAARRGCNVVVSTSTSSGKTLIFNLPVFNEIISKASVPSQEGNRGVEGSSSNALNELGGFMPDEPAVAQPEVCLEPRERRVTALYIFPTKALAQDQLGSCRNIAHAVRARSHVQVVVETFDGDTPQEERDRVRTQAEIIITNPDMLHVSILPSHRAWAEFLGSLCFIVIDEAHTYNGIFGSHVANVFKRLKRICDVYCQTVPQFFSCSATIANPRSLFETLCPSSSRECFVIGEEDDGSPCGRRLFGIWNPPLHPNATKEPKKKKRKQTRKTAEEDSFKMREEHTKKRKSSIFEVALLLSALTRLGVKTMAFCRTRKLTELVLRYTHDELKRGYKGKVYSKEGKRRDLEPVFAAGQPHLVESVCGYRGGYRLDERREIEDRLFNGKLLAVTATCALELGIDVGDLDAVILLGYPGSAASMWQQVGRAGRSGKDSLALFVCFNGPTDQYFAEHPEELLDKSRIESAVLDPFNKYVLKDHLLCAMHEIPFKNGDADESLFGGSKPRTRETFKAKLEELMDDKLILRIEHGNGDVEFQTHSKLSKPYNNVNLRIIDPVTFELYHGKFLMDTIPYSRAFYELYPGAIYMHQARSYLVSKLDLNTYKAYAHPTNVSYYTAPRDTTLVKVMGRFESKWLESRIEAHCGSVQIERSVWGYRKMHLNSGRVFEMHEFSLPSLLFETQAVWIDLSSDLQMKIERAGLDLRGGIHAVNHLICKYVQLYVMCHVDNVGTEHTMTYYKRPQPPRLILYDDCPGGLGIAEAAFEHFFEILKTCKERIDSCECILPKGCPNCSALLACTEYNAQLDKKAAQMILDCLLERNKSPKNRNTGGKRALPSTPEKNRARNVSRALGMGRARVEQMQIAKAWSDQAPLHSEGIQKR